MKLFTLTRPDSAGNVPCACCGLLVSIGEGVGHCDNCNTDTELQTVSHMARVPRLKAPKQSSDAKESAGDAKEPTHDAKE